MVRDGCPNRGEVPSAVMDGAAWLVLIPIIVLGLAVWRFGGLAHQAIGSRTCKILAWQLRPLVSCIFEWCRQTAGLENDRGFFVVIARLRVA